MSLTPPKTRLKIKYQANKYLDDRKLGKLSTKDYYRNDNVSIKYNLPLAFKNLMVQAGG